MSIYVRGRRAWKEVDLTLELEHESFNEKRKRGVSCARRLSHAGAGLAGSAVKADGHFRDLAYFFI